VIGLLIGLQAAAGSDPGFAQVRRFVDGVLILAGTCFAIFVLVSASMNLHGLLTQEKGETLLLVPTFTLALAPLLYAMATWSRWDRERVERRWRQHKVASLRTTRQLS
jgi:hypothetical protein